MNEKTWKSEAGPIQSKKVRDALTAIHTEGRTYTEKCGVIGVSESEFNFLSPFSPARAEAGAVFNALGEQFAWLVTRENYQEIIEAAGVVVVDLRKSRPVMDKRRTVEQEAEANRLAAEAEAARSLVEAEARREAAIREVEQRKARGERLGLAATVRYNAEHNGVEVAFPEKPPGEVISRLKLAGFHWSFKSQVWYKKYGVYSWATAHDIACLEIAPAPIIEREEESVEPDHFDVEIENRMAEQCGMSPVGGPNQ